MKRLAISHLEITEMGDVNIEITTRLNAAGFDTTKVVSKYSDKTTHEIVFLQED